jgi:hypothetical protein
MTATVTTPDYLTAADLLVSCVDAQRDAEQKAQAAADSAMVEKMARDLKEMLIRELGTDLAACATFDPLKPTQRAVNVIVSADGLNILRISCMNSKTLSEAPGSWYINAVEVAVARLYFQTVGIEAGVRYRRADLEFDLWLVNYSELAQELPERANMSPITQGVYHARRLFIKAGKLAKEAAEITEANKLAALAEQAAWKEKEAQEAAERKVEEAAQTIAQDAIDPETIEDIDEAVAYRLTVQHMEPDALIRMSQQFLEDSLRLHEAEEPRSGNLPAMSTAFSSLAMALMMQRAVDGSSSITVDQA